MRQQPDLTDLVDRALLAMLAMQRRSWEQGLAGQALLALGRFDAAAVLAVDAVANQAPDGRLADLGDGNVVNGAAALEPVLTIATRSGREDLAIAAERQVQWLISDAPRADDGTLLHVLDRREIWSDSVYMVVPSLVAAGRIDAALHQLVGHRRRLQDPETHLFAHIWDEDRHRLAAAGRLGRRERLGGGRLRSRAAPAATGRQPVRNRAGRLGAGRVRGRPPRTAPARYSMRACSIAVRPDSFTTSSTTHPLSRR